MSSLFKHLRLSLRTLSRHPRFTLLAVLYLTLGLGGNTLIFSVFKSVLLEPPPFTDPDRLVFIFDYYNVPGNSAEDAVVSPWNYLTRRERCRTLEGIAAIERRSFSMGAGAEKSVVFGAAVSADLMPLLGVDVVAGRQFLAEEDRPGSAPVVLLSHELWQSELGGEDWIGKSLRLNDENHTVIGILPAGFYDPILGADLWVPLGLDPADDSVLQRNRRSLLTIARLAEGFTLEQARAELAAVSEQMAEEYPTTNTDWEARIYSLPRYLIGDVESHLFALQAAAAFVWLIACANMANLLLIRLLEQRHEMALRAALGANRGALVGYGLSEGLVLAGIAGVLGLLAAELVLGLLPDLGPLAEFPAAVQRLDIDAKVVVFTVLLTVVTGLIIGVLPALRPVTNRLYEHLQAGRRSSASRRQRRFFDALVVAEIALAMTLLIGAGLMLQSLRRLQEIDVGFDLQHTLVARFELPGHHYSSGVSRSTFVASLTERVKALPGVEEAGVTTALPMGGETRFGTFRIHGRVPLSPHEMLFARYGLISPGYLRAMGIPLKDGRMLSGSDDVQASGVLLVSEKMAEKFWPGQNPIGQQLQRGQHPHPYLDDPKLTVVGVVGDIRYDSIKRIKEPAFYYPYPQHAERDILATQLSLVVRTTDEPRHLLASLRQVIRELDPSLFVQKLSTYEQLWTESFFKWRFLTMLLTVFAACALLLSLLGIYGVMSYAVSQQIREMGVRMAFGASPRAVLGLVLKRGLRMVLIGLVIGWVGAVALSQFLRSLVFEVRTLEPSVFLAAGAIFFVVAALACSLPARRAAAVSPIKALRYE